MNCGSERIVLVLPPSYLFDEDYDEAEQRVSNTFLCAQCLSDGEFQDSESHIHVGNIDVLWDEIKLIHPEMSAHDIGEEAEERLAELAEATPPLKHELPASWPIHCGDFSEYIATVDASELGELLKQEKLELPASSQGAQSLTSGSQVAVFACLTCQSVDTISLSG